MRRKTEEELKHLIYYSCPIGFDANSLASILNISRNNNKKNNITGALIYRSDIYLQYLEGPIASVDETFQKIKNDERHKELFALKESVTKRRLFAAWAMREDPIKTWMWTRSDVKKGLVAQLTPEQALSVFEKLSIEIDQFL